jgi:hypothetical protein
VCKSAGVAKERQENEREVIDNIMHSNMLLLFSSHSSSLMEHINCDHGSQGHGRICMASSR